jgi:hypothetical protein
MRVENGRRSHNSKVEPASLAAPLPESLPASLSAHLPAPMAAPLSSSRRFVRYCAEALVSVRAGSSSSA